MPTYLLHGFRWTRLNIRLHVIVNDLEDAASEWIMAPATSRAILRSFYEKYDFLPTFLPLSDHASDQTEATDAQAKHSTSKDTNRRTKLHHLLRRQLSLSAPCTTHEELNDARLNAPLIPEPCMDADYQSEKFNDWSPIKFLEQYDPDEMYSCSEPYAFVADYVVKVDLSVLLDEEKQKYEIERSKQHLKDKMAVEGGRSDGDGNVLSQDESGWLEKLRKELEPNEDIGWFVINCGDEERKIDHSNLGEQSESPQNVSSNSGGWREIFKGKNFRSRSKGPDSVS
ncbi:hypothetical protein K3495_g9732 [Podosphaera aphanis]|nr:hypothetical protein K3495_g9732 [Podosphaera aphanis]